jgi:hypothetical protein
LGWLCHATILLKLFHYKERRIEPQRTQSTQNKCSEIQIDKTLYHHEGAKDMKGSDLYTLKLRELRAFEVGRSFLRSLRLNVFLLAALPRWALCG